MTVEIRNHAGEVLLTVTADTLRGADLRGADLRDANLRGAYLQSAYLRGADLRGAYLQSAYLRDANLRGADLQSAYLQSAYLRDANLRGADLQGADLRGADLQGANLWGTNLRGAKNAELPIARTRILPDSGDVIGWKKAVDNRIVQLRIPGDVKRSHAMGRKCRAERAEVVAIFDADGQSVKTARSAWDYEFIYEVGAVVEPTTPFDTNMWNECSSGIHFYITRIEAENHV